VALKQILDRNRLEQVQVAEALAVSRISVGNWCNRRGGPNGVNLVRLLEYLRQFEPTLQASDLLQPSVDEPTPVQEG
jgi:hypothetical protein